MKSFVKGCFGLVESKKDRPQTSFRVSDDWYDRVTTYTRNISEAEIPRRVLRH